MIDGSPGQPAGEPESFHGPEAQTPKPVVYREDLSEADLRSLGPFIRAGFGRAGHEFEYTIGIPGYDQEKFIPPAYEHKLQEELGDNWEVMNRGTRLEVMPRGATAPADEVINQAINRLIEDQQLVLPVVFSKPIVQEPVEREAIRRRLMEE